MRAIPRVCFCLLIACAFVLVADAALRADGPHEARAIVIKAIKAHGGAERLAKFPAQTWNEEGVFYGKGQATPYSARMATHYPRRAKIDVEDSYVAVIEGDRGWMTVEGQTRELRKDLLEDRRNEQYADWLTTLVPLRDKKFKLALTADAVVETKSASGVQVSWKDGRGLNLYFDKGSGLLVKSEQRVNSQEHQGREVTQEITVLEFEEVQGLTLPRKTVVRRNGGQYLETTRTELKRLEKLDDSLFVRP